MDQLHVQIYGKTNNRDFGEELSAFRSVALGMEPTTVELTLRAPPAARFVEIRVDPDDKPSSFVLHDLKVRSLDGHELLGWNGDPKSLGKMVDLRAFRGDQGIIVESLSDDPFFLIPLDGRQADAIIVGLTVSQKLETPNAGAELVEAVRALQSSLRFSLDDLADQQEGLHDAVALQHAFSRSESAVLKEQLSTVLDKTNSVENRFDQREAKLEQSMRQLGLESAALRDQLSTVLQRTNSIENRFDQRTTELERSIRQLALESAVLKDELSTIIDSTNVIRDRFDERTNALEKSVQELARSTEKTRDEIFSEVRDEWRSIRRQISEVTEAALRQVDERNAELFSTVLGEIALLAQVINRLASSQHAMTEIRKMLGASIDADVLPILTELKSEAQNARERLTAIKSSFSWRLVRPFRIFFGGTDDP